MVYVPCLEPGAAVELEFEKLIDTTDENGIAPGASGPVSLPYLKPGVAAELEFEEIIGTTQGLFFVDTSAKSDHEYTYYIQSEDKNGNVSGPSNLVSTPCLAQAVTFDYVSTAITDLANRDKFTNTRVQRHVTRIFKYASHKAIQGKIARAKGVVKWLHRKVKVNEWGGSAILDPLFAENLEILLSKLIKRLCLVEAGILPAADLY